MNSTNKMSKQEDINSFLLALNKEVGGGKTYAELAEIANTKFGTKLSGENVRKRFQRATGGGKSTFEVELEANSFSGDWSHGWLKTDNASIFIRNEKGVMTYEEIRDDLIAEMKKHAPKYPAVKYKGSGKYLWNVNPADPHFGKSTAKEETGESYNLKIAEQRFNEGIDGLITKSLPFPPEQIVFVVGNDILHIDTPKRTTTAGTPQDTDGMWWEAYNIAKRCYIQAIEKLVQYAPVKLVFCPSNHDFMSGYMLTDAVVSWFSKSKNVSFHTSMTHRKYLVYGNNMIGYSHGDGARITDLPNLMLTEARGVAFKFGYWLINHGHHKDKRVKTLGSKRMEMVEEDKHLITEIHSRQGIDQSTSIYVEMVRTPSAPDRWHYTNGYKNIQAMESFIFDPQGGQVARITHFY